MGVKKLKNGKWQIDYYVKGERKRESYPNKTIAELALKKRKIEIAEGRFLDKKKEEKVKFQEFARTFIEVYSKPNKRSWTRDELSIKNLEKFFKGKYLSEITPYHLENYKKERIARVAPATVNRELCCLKTIYNKAIEWGKAKENPVRKVKFLKEHNEKVRFFEKEEIKKIVDNAPEPLRFIFIVALNTGMRLGEVISLEWRDIDINNRLIYVRDSKSGESRDIPMTKSLYNMLFDLKIKNEMMNDYPSLLFPRVKKFWVSHKFTELLKGLGIEDSSFHTIRHTAASYLAMMGINLKVIQEILGHKTFRMTLRYAHLSKSFKKEAMDAYDSQMDTFWTLNEKETKTEEDIVPYKALENKYLETTSRGGGMADATDLKSVGDHSS